LGDHQGLQQQQQQQQEITEDDDGKEKLILTAGSGYPFNTLGQILSSAGWSGLEFATGIPGSVGGAIFMNAGANARETVSSLVKVEYITRQGELCVVDPINASDFAYRKSPFQFMDQLLAIVSGTFELEASSNAKRRAREYMQKRNKSQPLKEKSAGCIFRNPSFSGEAAAVRPRSRPIASASASAEEELDNPTLSAGALIDRAGLKGVSCGSAQVSPVHANYLVCTGKTEQSSKDMKDLITLIKQRIKSETGISLQEEIRIIPYEVK
jgi:UDP-N-acetylmuramate dehydrogenase